MGNRQFLQHVDVVSPDFLSGPADQPEALPLYLLSPKSAVITESMAHKYFGNSLATGKTLRLGGLCHFNQELGRCAFPQTTVLVTGIVRDFPHNTQLSGDIFFPNTSTADPMSQERKAAWFSVSGWGYVELRPGFDVQAVIAKLPALIDRDFDPRKTAGISLRGSQLMKLRLTPFRDDHLSTDRYGSMTPAGSWTTVYGFTAIGALIFSSVVLILPI